MAATLGADQEEVLFYSFPIEKREDTETVNPVDGTPDLLIWGKATDGTIDGDREIVDPEWSAKALVQWADTGGNVRMSHDPKRPVGKGHQVHVTTEGHWVKSLICDPLCKHLIRQGVLNDYSVGISNPDFRYGDRRLDPEGKALRVITGKPDGSSRIAELSVCDRGSNFNSRFSVVKSADGFTGAMVGDADEIAKVSPAGLAKAAPARSAFSPADLNKLLEHRRVAEQAEAAKFAAESAVYKRDIDTATRRRLASQGRALPDLSYPIETHEDAGNAVTLALSGHGDVSAAKNLIRRIARKEGWQDILARLDGKKEKGVDTAPEAATETDKGATAMPAAPAAPAEVAKDDGGDGPGTSLHHDDGEDDDTDSDADAMDKSTDAEAAKADMPAGKPKVPCPKCKAMCKPKARFCGKCGGPMTAEKASKPTPDGGAVGAAENAMEPAPAHREPDGPAIEALEHDAHLPTTPDASVKTAMHLDSLGVDPASGMLHGLLCPAYDDASVKAAWPGADLSHIDEMSWQAKALEIAATAPLEEAEKASSIWTAARQLKAVTPDLHADIMEEARKAFRDANPGPGTAPTPGELSAERFNRPYITAGHSAPSPDHDGPNKAPIHPGHISASDFTRDLITAGHAADSPENSSGAAPIPAPEVPGVPSRVFYTNAMRQNARQAMQSMHDHIAMSYPDLCPMHGPGRMGEPPSHARPVAAGVGGPVPHGASKAAEPQEAPVDEAAIIAAAKAAKKAARRQRDELLDQIVKGRVSIDDARTALGIAPQDPGTALKAAAPSAPAPLAPAMAATVDPEVIEQIITKAQAPLLAELAEQRRIIDAIADQPDPHVTAYRGAALNKSSPAPAGPQGIQERAARFQDSFITDRIDTARNSPDPGVRLQAMYDLMEVHGLTGGTRT